MAVGVSVGELVERARDLRARSGRRILIGIAGPPGAGKSTLAADVVAELADTAVLVPMDGFHLAQRQLNALGRAERKGAPDTFDALGFSALLARIRQEREHDVFAPAFDRSIEEPIAGAIRISARAEIIIVEGNYLLSQEPAWARVATELDETWFLAPAAELRRQRLTDRHVRFGRSRSEAESWVANVDENNARYVESTAVRADLLISRWESVGGHRMGAAPSNPAAP